MRGRAQACIRMAATLLAVTAGGVSAQDPCPSASGAEAESGWSAYQAGDMAGARANFDAALARCANDQYARTGRGYVALRDGLTDEAMTLFVAVLRAEPNNVDALVGAGLGSWRAADLDAVRRHFERVVSIEPDHPTALEYLSLVDGANRATTGASDEAEEAWAGGDTDLAMALYSARLESDPADGTALLRVGLMRAWSEDYPGAIELLDRLVQLEPTNTDGRLARARVRAWQGDLATARAEVGEVLALTPDNADAVGLWALLQSWAGDLDGALETYERLFTLAPEHAEGRRQQGRALGWAGDFDESIAAYEAMLARRPDDLSVRAAFGDALSMAGRYAEAAEAFDRVIDAEPDNVLVRNSRTNMFAWSGRLVAAEEAALETVRIAPSSGQAWSQLSAIYSMQSRPADALEALSQASRLSPTDPAIRDRLQWLERSFAPQARPTFAAESDSDGNSMLTTGVTVRVHPTTRLGIDVRGQVRDMGQDFLDGTLARNSYRASVKGRYQAGPGWTFTAGFGANTTDADDVATMFAFDAMVRSPDRHPLRLSLSFTTTGLDETAVLASRGIRSTDAALSAHWFPDGESRVAASVSAGQYAGIETNGRRSLSLSGSRDVADGIAVGLALRGLSFEKNLSEGYFDPDFYGVAELTASWRGWVGPLALTVEGAPGLQQARRGAGVSSSMRALGRAGYQVGDRREIFLSAAYSSAGLNAFSNGVDGYRYSAIIVGVNWIL